MASYKGCFYKSNGEYVQISYAEHLLRLQPDSGYAQRHFIAVSGYLLEVPENEYRGIRREQKRQEYLEQCRQAFVIVPLHLLTGTIEDTVESVEALTLRRIELDELRRAIVYLDGFDMATYQALFLDGLTEVEYAGLLGITHQAVSKRKQRLISKLRGLLEG